MADVLNPVEWVFPVFHDHGEERLEVCLYQTAKGLLHTNLRTILVTVTWIILTARLLTTLEVTEYIHHPFAPFIFADFKTVVVYLNVASWAMICLSCTACMCLQASLLCHTTWRELWTCLKWSHALMSVVLIAVGLFSAGTFSFIVTKANATVEQLEMESPFRVLFEVTAVIRKTQSIFSAFFTATIAPMSLLWAHSEGYEQRKQTIKKLVLWRMLLWVHWNILIPTFFDRSTLKLFSTETLFHTASFLYRTFVIAWLFLLVVYINVPYGHCTEEQSSGGSSSNMVVPKEPLPFNPSEAVLPKGTLPTYPSSSELVCISVPYGCTEEEDYEESSDMIILKQTLPFNPSEVVLPKGTLPIYPSSSELVCISVPYGCTEEEGYEKSSEMVLLKHPPPCIKPPELIMLAGTLPTYPDSSCLVA